MLKRLPRIVLTVPILFSIPLAPVVVLQVAQPAQGQDQDQDQGRDQGQGQGQGQDPLASHSLEYWIQQVKSREWYKAKEALLVLQKVGPKARAAVPAILRAMKRKELVLEAIRALTRIGRIPKSAVRPLVECLRKKATCPAAMTAIASMGRNGKGAGRMLTRLIHKTAYRAGALTTLDAIGINTIKLLAKDLEGKRWRRDALQRVFALGNRAESTLPQLIKVLEFYPRFVADIGGIKTKAAQRALEKAKARFQVRAKRAAADRAFAARVIGRMGTPTRAVPTLKKVAFDFDAEAAKSAIWALMIHGADVAVPILTKAIDRRRAKNLEFLMAGLRGFGPDSKGAILTLKKLARRRGRKGQLAGKTVTVIERSMSYLSRSRSEDAEVAKAATLQLMEYGTAGLPGVLAALQSESRQPQNQQQNQPRALRLAVVRKLVAEPGRYLEVGARSIAEYPQLPRSRVDPAVFVPLLMEYLRGADQVLASRCCVALGTIGAPEAELAVPVLQEIVGRTDKSPELRIAACHALLAFGVGSELANSVFESFVPYVKSADEAVVRSVVSLFEHLGVRAESCVPQLVELFDAGGEVAGNAAKAVAAIGPEAIPELVKSLRDANPNRRSWSAYALGSLGPRAASAAAALRRVAADDAVEVVRTAAREALQRVQ